MPGDEILEVVEEIQRRARKALDRLASGEATSGRTQLIQIEYLARDALERGGVEEEARQP